LAVLAAMRRASTLSASREYSFDDLKQFLADTSEAPTPRDIPEPDSLGG
jgi:hypothetical protein